VPDQLKHVAVRQGFIIRNVGKLVGSPRAKKPKMKTLMSQEVAALRHPMPLVLTKMFAKR